ncbi:Beclin-1-like protein [Camellia lanceoleosa]|uniref:Beclin-1-like protein n=1 Tax=Camellia lanceoleosa TaxID=1840588 RepID=A0ACC0G2V9_9ERIC|nr:Beclin-1-like protein [Camellia lanceoleosa]
MIVENYSITQSFNKQENWTKALKYTLCNLKWALLVLLGTQISSLVTTVSSHYVLFAKIFVLESLWKSYHSLLLEFYRACVFGGICSVEMILS